MWIKGSMTMTCVVDDLHYKVKPDGIHWGLIYSAWGKKIVGICLNWLKINLNIDT